MTTINKKIFFDLARGELFGGKLLPSQVEGLDLFIDEYQRQNINDLRQFADILATVYHETDKTFQPIEEYGKGKGKPYGKNIKYDGTTYQKPKFLFFGRGYTQNTWFEVYEKLSALAKKEGKNWDFLNNPSLLLTPIPSIWATFKGMTLGIYTGKKLSDYYSDKTDWLHSRQIINRMDKAELISSYKIKFHQILLKCETS